MTRIFGLSAATADKAPRLHAQRNAKKYCIVRSSVENLHHGADKLPLAQVEADDLAIITQINEAADQRWRLPRPLKHLFATELLECFRRCTYHDKLAIHRAKQQLAVGGNQ